MRAPLLSGEAASEGDVDSQEDVDIEALLDAADNKEGLSFKMALFTSLNYNCGFGILCFGYNLSRDGWSGLVITLIAFCVCWVTAIMLGEVLERFPGIHSYAEIGNQAARRAFSVRSATVAAAASLRIFQILELFSYMLMSVVAVKEALLAIPGVSHSMSNLLMWAIIGPTVVLINPVHLSYMSLAGIAIFFVLYGVLAFESVRTMATTGIVYTEWPFFPARALDFSASYGGILLLFAGHAVYPSIYETLRHKRDYVRVVNWTFGIMAVLLLVLGLLMVAAFGHSITDLPTGSLERGTTMNVVAQICIIAKCVCAYPVIRFPIIVELVAVLKGVGEDEFDGGDSPTSAARGHNVLSTGQIEAGTMTMPMSYSPYLALTGATQASFANPVAAEAASGSGISCFDFSVGFVVAVLSLVVAMVLSSLGFVMSFVGSTFAVSLAVTIPGLCFAALIKPTSESKLRPLAKPITAFGLLSTVVSFSAIVAGVY
ncbi:Amino acid transporter AVT1D [Hondaea fermentalgiana]|uniref:Amino acid transporter AVT1D n=1 Tax=Hondaea fermentalgiana TaxID=2315210 RepID=A0A2R5GLI2_9STRA|nr:Amino acid transporter AVT1D [Hondaea fermentalgiana]|eukprot:GBG31762.1 Amino acid transporter AVT1D [Hondaea fermentalgiana]